jgi:hypothetical protein
MGLPQCLRAWTRLAAQCFQTREQSHQSRRHLWAPPFAHSSPQNTYATESIHPVTSARQANAAAATAAVAAAAAAAAACSCSAAAGLRPGEERRGRGWTHPSSSSRESESADFSAAKSSLSATAELSRSTNSAFTPPTCAACVLRLVGRCTQPKVTLRKHLEASQAQLILQLCNAPRVHVDVIHRSSRGCAFVLLARDARLSASAETSVWKLPCQIRLSLRDHANTFGHLKDGLAANFVQVFSVSQIHRVGSLPWAPWWPRCWIRYPCRSL